MGGQLIAVIGTVGAQGFGMRASVTPPQEPPGGTPYPRTRLGGSDLPNGGRRCKSTRAHGLNRGSARVSRWDIPGNLNPPLIVDSAPGVTLRGKA